MFKTTIVWIIILTGVILGVVSIVKGLSKNSTEKKKFKLLLFLKKGLFKTPFRDFTGTEIIAFGILSILSSLMIYLSFFKIYLK
jgi:hypothetical protein